MQRETKSVCGGERNRVSKRPEWVLGLILLLATAPSVCAQSEDVDPQLKSERPEESQETPPGDPPLMPDMHSFWDKTNVGLHGVNLVAQGLDYWTTRRAVERGYREMNPLVRPFAKSDKAMAAYSFGLSFGGTLATSYLLHRAGRHGLERYMPLLTVGTTGTAVGLNFRYVF